MDKEKELLSKMTLLELHQVLNKYCGPSDNLMCRKKYGTILKKENVEAEIMNRILLTEERLPGEE